MNFELLCMDTKEYVNSKTLNSLILAFRANDTLWSENIICKDKLISYRDSSLTVSFSEYDTQNFAVGSRFIPAYLISVHSDDYKKIEPLRMRIVDHVSEMKFSHIRILHDDVSKEIACKLYPLFYCIENKLREFIVNALVKKIGADFLKLVVSKEVIDKTKQYKGNETYFIGSNKVIGDVQLLYFDALGKIVYGDIPVFTQSKDILQKVQYASSLCELKKELLDGNFQKYFKDCFEKSDFQEKWTKLNTLRNKVAHNSYFVDQELSEAKKLSDDLTSIIDEAYEKIDTLQLSLVDREAIQSVMDENEDDEENEKKSDIKLQITNRDEENHISNEISDGKIINHSTWKKLDEATVLEKLKQSSINLEFVGLKHFVKEILGKEGYSFNASYTLINILIDKGILKTTKRPNLTGDFETTCIEIA